MKLLLTVIFIHWEILAFDKDGFLKLQIAKNPKLPRWKIHCTTTYWNTMKQSRFIDQIMVIGDGQNYGSAFIQTNFDF
jgi:long-chain acyl-CoA synthetase